MYVNIIAILNSMIAIAYKEYPGFEPMSIEEIQDTREQYSNCGRIKKLKGIH